MKPAELPVDKLLELREVLTCALATADGLRLDMTGIHIDAALVTVDDLLKPKDATET